MRPARHLAGLLLQDTERADDAMWVTTELASNALLYSRSGAMGGFFVVEVLRSLHTARIVVYDLGGGGAPDFGSAIGPTEPYVTPRAVDDLDEHGRGLRGVAGLSVKVGVAGDPACGHAVWAQLSLCSHREPTEQEVPLCQAKLDSTLPPLARPETSSHGVLREVS